MRFVGTYFTRGAVYDRYKVRIPFAIKQPPVTGYSFAFLLPGTKHITLFHPVSIEAFVVPDNAEEVALAVDQPYDPQKLIDLIISKCAEYRELKMQKNYTVAEKVIEKLKALIVVDDFEVPEDDQEDFLL